MGIGISLAGAVQPLGKVAVELMVRGFQLLMLAGEDQRQRDSSFGEGSGDRSKLDGLWTGANDQYDAIRQPSP